MQTLFGAEDGAGSKQKKAPGGELEEAAFMPAATFCGLPKHVRGNQREQKKKGRRNSERGRAMT